MCFTAKGLSCKSIRYFTYCVTSLKKSYEISLKFFDNNTFVNVNTSIKIEIFKITDNNFSYFGYGFK